MNDVVEKYISEETGSIHSFKAIDCFVNDKEIILYTVTRSEGAMSDQQCKLLKILYLKFKMSNHKIVFLSRVLVILPDISFRKEIFTISHF